MKLWLSTGFIFEVAQRKKGCFVSVKAERPPPHFVLTWYRHVTPLCLFAWSGYGGGVRLLGGSSPTRTTRTWLQTFSAYFWKALSAINLNVISVFLPHWDWQHIFYGANISGASSLKKIKITQSGHFSRRFLVCLVSVEPEKLLSVLEEHKKDTERQVRVLYLACFVLFRVSINVMTFSLWFHNHNFWHRGRELLTSVQRRVLPDGSHVPTLQTRIKAMLCVSFSFVFLWGGGTRTYTNVPRTELVGKKVIYWKHEAEKKPPGQRNNYRPQKHTNNLWQNWQCTEPLWRMMVGWNVLRTWDRCLWKSSSESSFCPRCASLTLSMTVGWIWREKSTTGSKDFLHQTQ